ncbi:MAG: DUF6580 family putative transport protein [Candidatus Doudnabacteria bacterium]|jgi:hypothetical protein
MILYGIIILAVLSRFIPHMPNVGLITALAMFSAVNMDWKKSVGITLAARFVSDIFLGFFAWPLMVAVYASHLAGILFGLWIKRTSNNRWAKIIFSSLATSVLFFLVTNFAYLYAEYPHNFAGIMLAYANGLPFLRGTLVGDLGYSVALFGVFQLVMYFKANQAKTKFLISNF